MIFPSESQTERLLLRGSDPVLAEALTAYFLRNQDFLADTEPPHAPEFYTVAFQREYLAQSRQRMHEGTECRYWLLRPAEPHKIIGMVSLNNIVRGAFQSAFVSYRSDAQEVRSGHITEALRELVRIAFDSGLHRLEANIMPRNAASFATARSLGFEEEGRSPKYLKIGSVWEDHIHMVLRNTALE